MKTNRRIGETYFDPQGEIDLAYDDAVRNNQKIIAHTIKAVECLMGFPNAPTFARYWLYRALKGDPAGARETARLFDWSHVGAVRELFPAFDRPKIAAYWRAKGKM